MSKVLSAKSAASSVDAVASEVTSVPAKKVRKPRVADTVNANGEFVVNELPAKLRKARKAKQADVAPAADDVAPAADVAPGADEVTADDAAPVFDTVSRVADAPTPSSDDAPVPAVDEAATAPGTVHFINIDDITIDPAYNIRRHAFDPKLSDDDKNLVAKIKEDGFDPTQPLLLRVDEAGHFVLVRGHRRYAACKLVPKVKQVAVLFAEPGLTKLQLLYDLDNSNSGKKLSMVERGMIAQRALAEQQTEEQIAKKLGVTKRYVQMCLRLLTAPESVQRMLELGQVAENVAYDAIKGHGMSAAALLREALKDGKVDENGIVKITQKHIDGVVARRSPKPAPVPPAADKAPPADGATPPAADQQAPADGATPPAADGATPPAAEQTAELTETGNPKREGGDAKNPAGKRDNTPAEDKPNTGKLVYPANSFRVDGMKVLTAQGTVFATCNSLPAAIQIVRALQSHREAN